MIDFVAGARLFDEELKVYETALTRFGDAGWNHRIARWYVRHKGERAFRDLTRKLMATLSGSEAERYLGDLVQLDWTSASSDRSAFYEAIHRMALDRFPERPRFAHALLRHYDRERSKKAQTTALVARYAALDSTLRVRLLQTLGAARRFHPALAPPHPPPGRPPP